MLPSSVGEIEFRPLESEDKMLYFASISWIVKFCSSRTTAVLCPPSPLPTGTMASFKWTHCPSTKPAALAHSPASANVTCLYPMPLEDVGTLIGRGHKRCFTLSLWPSGSTLPAQHLSLWAVEGLEDSSYRSTCLTNCQLVSLASAPCPP